LLLVGCYPASIFALAALRPQALGNERQAAFREWMVALLVVVVVVFSLVRTKIVHYSSLAYFPVTYLAAWYLLEFLRGRRPGRLVVGLTAALGSLVGGLFVAFPLALRYRQAWLHLVGDALVRARVEAQVDWTLVDTAPGLLLLVGTATATTMLLGKRRERGVLTLFGTATIGFGLAVWLFAPKIEAHTQRAAVEFYQGLRGQACYVAALGFKSYAPLFYSDKQRAQSAAARGMSPRDFERWLLEGDIDRPVFLVGLDRDDRHVRRPGIVELYRRNGFVFYRRDPPRPFRAGS